MTDEDAPSESGPSRADDAAGSDDADHSVADVKTTPDGRPIPRTAPPEQWEAVGRQALTTVLHQRRDEIRREIAEVVAAIDYGAPVTDEHVRNLRGAIETLEITVENRLVPLADDVAPWERTPDRVPAGRLADALDRGPGDLADSPDDADGAD